MLVYACEERSNIKVSIFPGLPNHFHALFNLSFFLILAGVRHLVAPNRFPPGFQFFCETNTSPAKELKKGTDWSLWLDLMPTPDPGNQPVQKRDHRILRARKFRPIQGHYLFEFLQFFNLSVPESHMALFGL